LGDLDVGRVTAGGFLEHHEFGHGVGVGGVIDRAGARGLGGGGAAFEEEESAGEGEGCAEEEASEMLVRY
jgi:hypothetical protein